ncbi:MAG: Tol-Pal system beta propeller repeat protein TolB [bacterium]
MSFARLTPAPRAPARRGVIVSALLLLLSAHAAAESLPEPPPIEDTTVSAPASSFGDEIWLRLTQTGGKRRLSLVIAPFRTAAGLADSLTPRTRETREVISADLRFSLHFSFPEPEPGDAWNFETDPAKVDLKGWGTTGAEVLVTGQVVAKRGGPALEINLYDLNTNRRIASKGYPLRPDWRWLAHEVADDIIKLLTGFEGINRTRIAFSRQVAPGQKELAMVDYDGANPVRLTDGGSTKLFPAWSPDGRRLAYCSFSSRSLDIHLFGIADRSDRRITHRDGLSTTPAWSPDGRTIAASLSFDGRSEICLLDANGGNLRRLTNSRAIEISPTWSPDGRQLALVSDRTGAPQVYVMSADGTDFRRLTFEGAYNTTPAWSPQGDLVAFVQRQPDGRHQVCVTNILGDTYVRLTTRGSNEDPSWSPDGMHIAFTSTRDGAPEIYVMNWNGANQTRVTRLNGASAPTWSPVLR